jgi:hypothetical protein
MKLLIKPIQILVNLSASILSIASLFWFFHWSFKLGYYAHENLLMRPIVAWLIGDTPQPKDADPSVPDLTESLYRLLQGADKEDRKK